MTLKARSGNVAQKRHSAGIKPAATSTKQGEPRSRGLYARAVSFLSHVHVLAVILTFFAVPFSAQSTQVDVSGAWAVTLEAPRGDVDFRMWIVQKGSRLTGYMLSEVGQFDMEGSITGNQIKFSWNFPDGGQMVAISCQGKVEGNSISGTAKVGNFGEGPMNAERR